MKDGRRLTLAEYQALAIEAIRLASTQEELQEVKTITLGKNGFFPRLFREYQDGRHA